jgi:hypothetical protein
VSAHFRIRAQFEAPAGLNPAASSRTVCSRARWLTSRASTALFLIPILVEMKGIVKKRKKPPKHFLTRSGGAHIMGPILRRGLLGPASRKGP